MCCGLHKRPAEEPLRGMPVAGKCGVGIGLLAAHGNAVAMRSP